MDGLEEFCQNAYRSGRGLNEADGNKFCSYC